MIDWIRIRNWICGVPAAIPLPQPEPSFVHKHDVMAPISKKTDAWLRKNLPRSYGWAREEYLRTARDADRRERKARNVPTDSKRRRKTFKGPGAVVPQPQPPQLLPPQPLPLRSDIIDMRAKRSVKSE